MRKRRSVPTQESPGFTSEEVSLGLYLKQISKSKALKSAEEADLAKRIRKGDRRAFNRLVHANLRFVVSVAMNYRNQGLSISDLINEGNMGLLRAARRFDERRKFRFISYAVWWIRQAILQALAEQSRIVKVPLNQVSTIHKIGKATKMLEQKLQRSPDLREISKELRIDLKEVTHADRIGSPHASLDAPLAPGEDGKLVDLLEDHKTDSPDDCIDEISLQGRVNGVLHTLEHREAEIIRLYFGIGHDSAHTLEQIGARFHLTRERVRQIKEKALKRLKHSSRSQLLRTYRELS